MCYMQLHRWILRGDSEAGVDMFVQMQPAMQPSAVLPIVQVSTHYSPACKSEYFRSAATCHAQGRAAVNPSSECLILW